VVHGDVGGNGRGIIGCGVELGLNVEHPLDLGGGGALCGECGGLRLDRQTRFIRIGSDTSKLASTLWCLRLRNGKSLYPQESQRIGSYVPCGV
jgi:hypothetical protein